MTDFEDSSELRSQYAGARARLIDLTRTRPETDWAISTPACAGWIAHDVLAHLAANTTDALAGRLTGPPPDEFTAGQVADRAERSVTELASEWEANASIDDVFDQLGMAVVALCIDALTHEADIRGALGEPRPPAEAVAFHFHHVAGGFGTRVTGAGLPAVEIVSDGASRVAGDGDPGIELHAGAYDLGRAFMGRRSASQVRAFEWSGDPDPYVPVMTGFTLAPAPVVD